MGGLTFAEEWKGGRDGEKRREREDRRERERGLVYKIRLFKKVKSLII